MTEAPTPYEPYDPDGRAYTPTPAVEALLDAQFAQYEYRVCECGSTLEPPAAVCHACQTGNRKLGPLYGGSLAGPVVYAGHGTLPPYPLADEPCARCDDLLEQNDAQAIENSDLARQVVSLRGHLETMAAQVRQGKAGT